MRRIAAFASILLRIDQGDPSLGNGALYTADSLYVMRGGKVVRSMAVRFTMPLFPSPDNRSQDVRLENNVPVGGGWLATRVRILDKGVPVQTEEYSDWKSDVALPESFFQVEHWSEGPHWAKPAGK
jgi:hypothetical protein